ncbi:dehydrogenase [Amylocarpus encephaloides]|uniref:Dehydrogenase n=1 Tax=Amylocarpus encephaloides TaxID=45428 RepID=A0A9P7YGM8_9HELO|nr:dehydrogenase [Amylocarpus encephaloides]
MGPYNAETTAEEVALECQSIIANKTILVTGASAGGLGATFATIVAKYRPACIILATRDLAKAEATAKEIATAAPAVRTRCTELDLASMQQIRKAAEEINLLDEHIDVIVNNAGIMANLYTKTVDGIESQFGTNHIGHFLLTNLLLPKLLSRGQPIRIVNVSSNGFRFGPVRYEDTDFGDGKTYNRWAAYAQSKSANMLFSRALAQRFGKQGLVSASLHPGVIWTNISRSVATEDFAELGVLDRQLGYRSHWDHPFVAKSPSQGVATHIFAAFHPSLDSLDLNGSYLQDCGVVELEKIQSWARDPIDARLLWDLSEKMVSQKF